jgi:hypothetical protein
MVTTSLVSVRLLAGRSYILTGLMKSQGDSGAKIVLLNYAKDAILTETQTLHETRDWTQPDTQDNYRYASPVFVPQADMDAWVELRTEGAAGTAAWFDAVKLEESTVATPWSPGMIGASVLDAGGVQIDGTKGGVFRYRGRDGNIRSMVEGGPSGLVFAGDTEITSPSDGQIAVDGTRVSLEGHTHAGAGLQPTTTIPRGTDATEGAELVLEAAPAGTEWHIDTHGDDLRIFHTPDPNPVVVRAGDIILPGNQSISALIARIAALEAAGGGLTEEVGSATPTTTGFPAATKTAEWVKIGRIVAFRVTISVTANGSGSTGVTVTVPGMPPPATTGAIIGDRGGTGVLRLSSRITNSGGNFSISSVSTIQATPVAITGADCVAGASYNWVGSYLAAP